MNHRNAFTDSLNQIIDEGRTMNESSMFEIPIGLLAFMDGEINNPERYQYKVLEEVEASAISYANRVNYLQVTHCMIVRMTTTAWYTQNQLADSLHFQLLRQF